MVNFLMVLLWYYYLQAVHTGWAAENDATPRRRMCGAVRCEIILFCLLLPLVKVTVSRSRYGIELKKWHGKIVSITLLFKKWNGYIVLITNVVFKICWDSQQLTLPLHEKAKLNKIM
jgi:hypothetical protein